MTPKPHFTRTLLFIALALVLAGCAGSRPTVSRDLQKSFQQIIPDTELNTHLQLVSDQEKASLNKDFKLYLKNMSADTIYFDPQQPFRLFISENNQWVEIKNKGIYLGGPDGEGILLYPENSGLDIMGSVAHSALLPSVAIEQDEVILRIVALGETMADGERTGNRVGATLDVLLEINP